VTHGPLHEVADLRFEDNVKTFSVRCRCGQEFTDLTTYQEAIDSFEAHVAEAA
jgi:hypothetical protein